MERHESRLRRSPNAAVAIAALLLVGCETTAMREFEADMDEWRLGRDAALADRGITLRDFELMRLEFERPCAPIEAEADEKFDAWTACMDATGTTCGDAQRTYLDAADERAECTEQADQLVSEWLGLDEGLWTFHERRDSERAAARAARAAANPGGTGGWREALGFLGTVARVTVAGMSGDVPTLDLTRQIAGIATGGNSPVDAILGLVAAGSAPAPAPAGLAGPQPGQPATPADGGELDRQLAAMEGSCGFRYAGTTDERDHGRFYCMRAYAAECALRKGPNPNEQVALARMCSLVPGCPHCAGDGTSPPSTNAGLR